jgi:benzodiazapine receptor
VWSLLYPSIAWSGYRTFRAQPSPARTRALAFWGAQLGLNAAWSPLFFGLHQPKASLVDSALLLAAATNYTRHAGKVDKAAAIAMWPYLGWLTFATVLNADIVRRNA